jgi:hypothetical protein
MVSINPAPREEAARPLVLRPPPSVGRGGGAGRRLREPAGADANSASTRNG